MPARELSPRGHQNRMGSADTKHSLLLAMQAVAYLAALLRNLSSVTSVFVLLTLLHATAHYGKIIPPCDKRMSVVRWKRIEAEKIFYSLSDNTLELFCSFLAGHLVISFGRFL
jgi:hypothetical protein